MEGFNLPRFLFEVWLLLFLCAAIFSISIRVLYNTTNSGFNIIMDILRLLTTQSNVKMVRLTKMAMVKYKLTLIIFIILALFFSIILTKSFSSLFLNSYFRVEKYALIENLDQLLENDKMRILATNLTMDRLGKHHVLASDQLVALGKRRRGDFRYKNVRKDFRGVLRGRLVFLGSSLEREMIEGRFKTMSDRFAVSDRKYVNRFVTYLAHKESVVYKDLDML